MTIIHIIMYTDSYTELTVHIITNVSGRYFGITYKGDCYTYTSTYNTKTIVLMFHPLNHNHDTKDYFKSFSSIISMCQYYNIISVIETQRDSQPDARSHLDEILASEMLVTNQSI
jgi:hypothetical protein